MQSLKELKNSLQNMLGKPTLVLDNTLDLPQKLIDFINTLPKSQLVLSGASIQDGKSKNSFRLVGTNVVSWKVEGIEAAQLGSVRLSIYFIRQGAEKPVEAELTVVQADLLMLEKKVSVQGKLVENGRIQVELIPDSVSGKKFTLKDLAHNMAGEQLTTLLPSSPDTQLFDAVGLSQMEISFGFDKTAATEFVISVDADTNWTIIEGGVFELKQVGVTLRLSSSVYPDGSKCISVGGNIHATTHIGEDFKVVLSLQGQDRWQLTVLPKDGAMPALKTLAELVGALTGQKNLAQTVENGLSAVGLSDLYIDDVRIAFDLHRKKLTAVYLRTHAEIEDARMDLHMQLPHFEIGGEMPPETPAGEENKLQLSKLVARYFSFADELPEVDITQLDFYALPDEDSYRFDMQLKDDWKIEVESTSFSISEFGLSVSKSQKAFWGRVYGKTELAGIDFVLSAEKYQGKDAGWKFEASGGNDKGIELTKFVSAFIQQLGLPALPSAVPQITLENLDFTYNTADRGFSFTGKSKTKACMPLCQSSFELDVSLAARSSWDSQAAKRDFSGSLKAELEIGKAIFDLEGDFNKDIYVIKGCWHQQNNESVTIDDLLKTLGVPKTFQIPAELDKCLGLNALSFKYNVSHEIFTAIAKGTQWGEAFIQVGKIFRNTVDTQPQKVSDKWEVVFGIAMPTEFGFADIPGEIGEFLKLLDFIRFEEGYLVISTLEMAGYKVPQLPELAGVKDDWSTINKTGLNIVAGINAGFLIDFEQQEENPTIAHLNSIVSNSKLLLSAEIDIANKSVAMEADLEGYIGITNNQDPKIRLGDAKLKISTRPLSLVASGGTQIPFSLIEGKETLYATGSIGLTDAEVEAAFDISANKVGPDEKPVPASLNVPFGLPGIKLDELGAEMGFMFQEPGIDFGIEGKLHVGDEPVGDDKFAIVLDMEEEVPNPTLMYGYLATLSMEEIVTACLDQSVPLPSFINDIKIEQLMLYWSESDQMLPDRTIAAQGFGFNGMIEIYGFAAHASLMIKSSQGISGDAEMSPIELKGILIKGDGKAVKVTQIKVNDQWQTVKKFPSVLEKEKTESREYTLIPAGGPALLFSTLKSPYFSATADIQFFGLLSEKVYVSITEHGFCFDLEYKIANVAEFKVGCTLNIDPTKNIYSFGAHASFVFALKKDIPVNPLGVDLGSIHLDVDFSASFAIQLDTNKFLLAIDGEFEFEGLHLKMPRLNINEPLSDIEDLIERIGKQILDEAEEIFADIFNEAKKLIDDGIKEVEEIGKAAEQEAAKIASKAADEANKIIEDAKKTAKVAEKEIAAEAEKINQEASKVLDDAEKVVNGIEEQAAADCREIEKAAQQILDDAEKEVVKIASVLKDDLEKLDTQISNLEKEAEAEVKKLEQEAVQVEKEIWDTAKKTVAAIAADAEKAAEAIYAEAKRIEKEVADFIAAAAKKLEEAAKAAGKAVEHTAKKVWHAISKY
ncbi:MAG: hypothetical protein ACC651_02135 [Candidatus Scalindua sp.]